MGGGIWLDRVHGIAAGRTTSAAKCQSLRACFNSCGGASRAQDVLACNVQSGGPPHRDCWHRSDVRIRWNMDRGERLSWCAQFPNLPLNGIDRGVTTLIGVDGYATLVGGIVVLVLGAVALSSEERLLVILTTIVSLAVLVSRDLRHVQDGAKDSGTPS